MSKIGVNDQLFHVAHHEQARAVQIFFILLKLFVGGFEVFVLAFVFPAEMIALPHIGPTLTVARSTSPRDAFFKREIGSVSVFVGRRMSEQAA